MRRKRRQRKPLKTTYEYAKELRENLPASEVWFWEEWDKAGMRDPDDLSNMDLNKTIPDVINKRFKYVIEVDGAIHLRKDIKAKDQKKDIFYRGLGYEVFRLEAYNHDQLGLLMDKVEKRRELRRTRVIIRRTI